MKFGLLGCSVNVMAAYIEIKPDEDDLESDIALPSTSTGGARSRYPNNYNVRSDDSIPYDASMEFDSETGMTHNENVITSGGRSNGKRQENHVQIRPDKGEHKEPEHGTEAEMREFEFCVKTPISDGPIIDLRGREVLFAIGVFFFLSVSIGLIVVLASDKITAAGRLNKCEQEKVQIRNDIRQTCVTKQCMSRAAEMLDMMDLTVSPCQDFYRYSCGGWLDKAEIPSWEKSWGVDKELTARIHRDINKILTSDVTHCNQSDCAERKMKIFYRQCMDLDYIDELGTRQILKVMDNLGGWALFDDWNLSTKPGRWNLQNALKELHHIYLVKVFFQMFVRPDDMTGGMTIQFDQSALPYPQVFNGDPQKEQAYRIYLRTMAKQFGASDRNVAKFVNETWQFEKDLAEIHVSEMDMARNDPNAMYNSRTIGELEMLSPRIKWLEYVNDVFPDLTINSTVLVTDPNYFQQLSDLLTKLDEKTLNFYVMWRLLDDFAADLPWSFRKAHKTFQKAYTGQKSKSREMYCLDKVTNAFGYEVGARFVAKYLPADDKANINSIVGRLKRELNISINNSNWLSAETKNQAKRKLKAMRFEIGYPDMLLDEEAVNDYYSDFHVGDNDTYFDLVRNYYKKELNLMKEAYHGTILAEDWNMPIYETNAFHNPIDNVVVFPAGLLQRPFYDHHIPQYINYGSIGSILAHEMIHGFNGIGALYDSNGMLSMWWPDDRNMSTCVMDYYSSHTVDGHKVNGYLTQNEDVADIEGLKLAYYAYDNRDEQGDIRMPGLNMDNKRLLFLAFAQSYCKKRRKDLIPSFLNSTSHTIENIRVLGTLAQVPEFAQTFQCDEPSPLNPKHRCSLWKRQ